jgi:NAD(P)H-hydrate epimerase
MTALTRDQVRELDRRAIQEYGVPGVVLMENAGRGAAELLMRLNPERRLTTVSCGKGNNAGDGFVIARHLDLHGWPVAVILQAHPDQLSGDAAVNYRIIAESRLPILDLSQDTGRSDGLQPPWTPERLERRVAEVTQFNQALSSAPKMPGWIVDALFGTGLSGPIRGPLAAAVEGMNMGAAAGFKVFAVDIPSGLDCDTGRPLGPTVRAHHTATFVAPKAGFAAPEAREWLGEVHVLHIGAPRALLEQYGVSGYGAGA